MNSLFTLLFIAVTTLGQGITCNAGITCTLVDTFKLTVSGSGAWTSIEGIEKTKIQGIIIGKGITSIEHTFFSHSYALTSVTCPTECTLKKIGDAAFQGCNQLKSISIDTIETIGNKAFDKGTSASMSLSSFSFKNIKTIGDYAFQNTQMNALTFPATLESIGKNAFAGCAVIFIDVAKENTIYSSVNNAILYELKNNVKSLVIYSHGAQEFNVPNGVTVIKEYAIYNLRYLKKINLNEVVTIEKNAFFGCSGLEEVTFGKSTTDLRKGIFVGCNAIKKFIVHQDNSLFESVDDILYTKNKENKALIKYPAMKEIPNNGIYSIPAGVKVIYDYAFEGITGLKELTIGGDVYSIHSYVFKGCLNLKKVTISAPIKSVGTSVFEKLEQLSTVILGDNVKMIGKKMFANCPLTSFTMSKGVMTIESHAFFGSQLTSIEIPNTCVFIMSHAFASCNSLTSVKIGSAVKEISKEAFFGCWKLTSVDLSSATSLQRIDKAAFSSSSNIESIVIPASVKAISKDAFRISKLSSVKFLGTAKPNICSLKAFQETKVEKVKVPANYQHQRFCGLEIEKETKQS